MGMYPTNNRLDMLANTIETTIEMGGFTKLDSGILQSSIMGASPETFKVWIALLAACEADGISRVSPVFIASVGHMSIEQVRAAIEELSSPDQDSRTLECEGRRIERIDGGFRIINYLKYREYTFSKNPESIRKREYRHRRDSEDNGTSLGHDGTNLGHVPKTTGHSASSSVSSSDSSLSLKEGGLGETEKEHFDPTMICPFFQDPDFESVWSEYREVRRRKKAVYTPRAVKDRLEELMRLCGGDRGLAIKIVAQSADKGWTSFYKLPLAGGGLNNAVGLSSSEKHAAGIRRGRELGGAASKPGEYEEVLLL